jgi:hypothetical protein
MFIRISVLSYRINWGRIIGGLSGGKRDAWKRRYAQVFVPRARRLTLKESGGMINATKNLNGFGMAASMPPLCILRMLPAKRLHIYFLWRKNMGIDIKDSHGRKVYTVSGLEVKDSRSRLVLKFDNDEIKDPSGRQLFRYDNDDIKDNRGHTLYKYDNDEIKDASGRRICKYSASKIEDSRGRTLYTLTGPVHPAIIVGLGLLN